MTLAPGDTACPCCRAPMVVIGEDTSERLDVIPVKYQVIVTHRPKFACRSCTGTVVQMPAPPRLIEGGLPTEAMVAHVLVARYADHLPLYRQAQMFAREGVLIDRSTLSENASVFFGTRQTNLVFQDEVSAPFETKLRDFGCNVCEAATSRAISRGFENIGDCRHSRRC